MTEGNCRGFEIVMEVSIFGSRCHRVFSLKKSYMCFEVARLCICYCCTNCLKHNINGVYIIWCI